MRLPLSSLSVPPRPTKQLAGGGEGPSASEPWRPFVLAALFFTLTIGALTGAIDLWHLRVTLQPVPLAHHRAHGFAQLFGFLGLFTQGMSLHLAPRFFGAAPATKARRALLTWTAIPGVALLVVGQLGQLVPGSAALALLGALLVLAGMTGWTSLLLGFRRAVPRGQGDALQRFLLAGTLWWWLASALTLLWTMGQSMGGPLAGVPLEVVWASALFGGAGSWLWGIFLRAGLCTLKVKRPSESKQQRLFVAWQLATCLAVLSPAFDAAWLSAAQQLSAAGAVALLWWTVRPLSGEGLAAAGNLSPRAVQAGLCFLAGFGALSGWGALSELGVGAPPLLHDATRHAFTLGGTTLLVLGFAGRMVPGFSGRGLRWKGGYDAGVLAVAFGALLRQAELLGPTKLGLALAGASGGLVFLGLALVAASLVGSMRWASRAPLSSVS